MLWLRRTPMVFMERRGVHLESQLRCLHKVSIFFVFLGVELWFKIVLTSYSKMHATSSAEWVFTKTMAASFCQQRKERRLQRHWARRTLHVSCKTMGESGFALAFSICVQFCLTNLTSLMHSLLTVGRTVDEAAILYSMLENACQSQLLAEAAAANGLPKKIIKDDAAKFTAEAAQNPVS